LITAKGSVFIYLQEDKWTQCKTNVTMQIVSHVIFAQYTFFTMLELSSVAVPWAKAFESKLNLLSNSRVEQTHHFSSIS